MLPSKKILPVIQYKEGSKMKIVELIYAIENENITIINTARFTQFMLQLFNISNQQYKKDCHEIRTRKENSIFLKELIKKLKEISQ
jgi:F0F1-type ATP synthase alpha subunit